MVMEFCFHEKIERISQKFLQNFVKLIWGNNFSVIFTKKQCTQSHNQQAYKWFHEIFSEIILKLQNCPKKKNGTNTQFHEDLFSNICDCKENIEILLIHLL